MPHFFADKRFAKVRPGEADSLDGRPSCFDNDQHCGVCYVRTWAISLWLLLTLLLTTSGLVVYFATREADLRTRLAKAQTRPNNILYAHHNDDNCVLGEDLSRDPQYHLRKCTYAPGSTTMLTYLMTPTVLQNGDRTRAQNAQRSEQIMLDVTLAATANNLISRDSVGLATDLTYQLRVIAPIEDEVDLSWQPGQPGQPRQPRAQEDDDSSTDATFETPIHADKNGYAPRASDAFEWILTPLRYYHYRSSYSGSRTIDHLWTVSMLFEDGSSEQTLVKQVGNVLHFENQTASIGAALHDLAGILARALPIVPTLLGVVSFQSVGSVGSVGSVNAEEFSNGEVTTTFSLGTTGELSAARFRSSSVVFEAPSDACTATRNTIRLQEDRLCVGLYAISGIVGVAALFETLLLNAPNAQFDTDIVAYLHSSQST